MSEYYLQRREQRRNKQRRRQRERVLLETQAKRTLSGIMPAPTGDTTPLIQAPTGEATLPLPPAQQCDIRQHQRALEWQAGPIAWGEPVLLLEGAGQLRRCGPGLSDWSWRKPDGQSRTGTLEQVRAMAERYAVARGL